jgi:hypothetical protein
MKQKFNQYFEMTVRKSNGEIISTLKEDKPESLKKLVFEIHDHFDCMPNDWLYSIIQEAFENIEENYSDNTDIDTILSDLSSDLYYSDLLDWLSNPFAPELMDEAEQEYGYKDFYSLIQNAQLLAKDKIYRIVNDFIEEQTEEEV